MVATLQLFDETTTGARTAAVRVEIHPGETLTLRELIARRVRAEVARFNGRRHELFRGLVQPTDTEVTTEGYRLRRPRLLDADEQVVIALEAFARNGFFVLIADRQLDDLDAPIVLQPDDEVSFVKLVPLVGG